MAKNALVFINALQKRAAYGAEVTVSTAALKVIREFLDANMKNVVEALRKAKEAELAELNKPVQAAEIEAETEESEVLVNA